MLKGKRKRIIKKKIDPRSFNKFKKSPATKTVEISPEEAQKRVRETLAKLQGSGKEIFCKKQEGEARGSQSNSGSGNSRSSPVTKKY